MTRFDRFTAELNARLATGGHTCWFWRIVLFGFTLGCVATSLVAVAIAVMVFA